MARKTPASKKRKAPADAGAETAEMAEMAMPEVKDKAPNKTPKTKAKTPKTKAKSAKKKQEKDPLQALLDKHDFLERVSTSYGDKIRCTLSEHEMPPKAEAVQKHLESKKLRQAREKWWSDDWAEKYEPEIVAHKKNDKKLWCTVTEQALNKIPSEVEAHVNGKRFRNMKKAKDAKKAKQEEELARRKARIAKRIAARKAAAAAKNGDKAPEDGDAADDGETEGHVVDDVLDALEESDEEEAQEEEDEEEVEEEDEDDEEEEEAEPSPPPARRKKRGASSATKRRRKQ